MVNNANVAFNAFRKLVYLFHNLYFPKYKVKISINKKQQQIKCR